MHLFYNGTIHTMDSNYPNPEAVLVNEAGRIEAVGAYQVLAQEVATADRVDLEGRTLIPGFNDAHVHVIWLGHLLVHYVDARIHVAPNIPAIIEKFRERAASEPAGEWVVGVGYNEALLPEGRHLTR